MGAKIVLDMHEITPEFYMSKYGIAESSWTIRLLTYIEKISFEFADHVITINEPIQDLLVRRGLVREKSTVIMNAVDEARFAASPRMSAAADAAAASKPFVMMYHGTLTPIYGLDIAIEAFALAHRQMPGAELWILGSGTEEEALASLASERGVASQGQAVRAGRLERDSRMAGKVRRRHSAHSTRRVPRLRVSEQAAGVHHHGQARRHLAP